MPNSKKDNAGKNTRNEQREIFEMLISNDSNNFLQQIKNDNTKLTNKDNNQKGK